jgi:hypothetical protein
VPQEILDKPAALTSAEWRTVVQHPRIGQVILEQAAALKDAVPIILHHHERFAGHGYPFGLRANEIPLGARIVAIADAYDAMINDRPYKRAVSHEQAIAELRRHAGTQFDPELVELFCDLYANEAPTADPAVAAMSAAGMAHRQVPQLVPRSAPARPARRRRRSEDAADGDGVGDTTAAAERSMTMGPDGELGLRPDASEPRTPRRRPDGAPTTPTSPITTIGPGSGRTGRSGSTAG